MLSRLVPAFLLLLVALALSPGLAGAQPILIIQDASISEGNSGTKVLSFPVTLSSASASPVTAQFSAIPLSGTGFNAATGGTVCGGAGVDFQRQDLVPFSMAAGTTSTTVNVTLCGDTAIETDEQIFVSLTSVVGATCLEGTCNGVGTIRDDDGTPSISINSIGVSEPLSGSRTASFTVSLSHTSQTATSVHFATRNGIATGGTSCGVFIDYVSTSGTLTIPAGSLSGTIPITICGDTFPEGSETFFVDLSSPSPAGVTITTSSGKGTIRNAALFTGVFDVSPDGAAVRVGDLLVYTITWTVPEGEVWRDLGTIDMRIRGGELALWVRWDERANTFSLCDFGHGGGGRELTEPRVSCGPGFAPGSPLVLETNLAQLYLPASSVTGSGPTGPSVTLQLGVVFTDKAAGHSYTLELAATDDLGHRDAFQDAASVEVKRARD